MTVGSIGLEGNGFNMAVHLQMFNYFLDGLTKGNAGACNFLWVYCPPVFLSYVFPIKLDSRVVEEWNIFPKING